MTGRVNDWNRQSMKKDGSKPTMGVRSTGSLFHSQAPIYMADGGDVEEARMKQRGLDESNKEKPTGFFQRIREGNIDDPKSEAYKKYGAGRGRMEAELDAAIKEADDVKAKSGAKPVSQAPAMVPGMDERDRREESVANYKAVEITPLPVSRPIESRPIPAPKSMAQQERRSAIRMNDVRSTTRRQREEAARAKDKLTFGALNRTETNRSQREAAMREDKKTY